MIIKEIVNRRSVREYKSDPVSDEQILEVIKAAQFSPSASDNHAIEFIVVKDQDTKNKLYGIIDQEFVKQAPVLIVLATDTSKTPCPLQDMSAAAANMLLQATALGLGSVWKNVRPEFADQVKSLLGIPSNFLLNIIVPIGYAKEKQMPHAETEFEKGKIRYERW